MLCRLSFFNKAIFDFRHAVTRTTHLLLCWTYTAKWACSFEFVHLTVLLRHYGSSWDCIVPLIFCCLKFSIFIRHYYQISCIKSAFSCVTSFFRFYTNCSCFWIRSSSVSSLGWAYWRRHLCTIHCKKRILSLNVLRTAPTFEVKF